VAAIAVVLTAACSPWGSPSNPNIGTESPFLGQLVAGRVVTQASIQSTSSFHSCTLQPGHARVTITRDDSPIGGYLGTDPTVTVTIDDGSGGVSQVVPMGGTFTSPYELKPGDCFTTVVSTTPAVEPWDPTWCHILEGVIDPVCATDHSSVWAWSGADYTVRW
jgi:hypothetical protein